MEPSLKSSSLYRAVIAVGGCFLLLAGQFYVIHRLVGAALAPYQVKAPSVAQIFEAFFAILCGRYAWKFVMWIEKLALSSTSQQSSEQ